MTGQALALLARFCVKYDAIALCDEVWEHVIFDGRAHVPLMAMEGMRERTVKIGSAGKIFSLTGWKVGLVCAAPAIMRVIARAHQFITFTTPPNLQSAVAYGLMKDDAYFTDMRAAFQRSRDRFSAGLVARGFDVLPSAGTYFVNIDIAALGRDDDVAFCKWLVEDHGVAAIPVSAFYAHDAIRTVVRFCFAKHDSTLDAALARLDNVARSASALGAFSAPYPVDRQAPGRYFFAHGETTDWDKSSMRSPAMSMTARSARRCWRSPGAKACRRIGRPDRTPEGDRRRVVILRLCAIIALASLALSAPAAADSPFAPPPKPKPTFLRLLAFADYFDAQALDEFQKAERAADRL